MFQNNTKVTIISFIKYSHTNNYTYSTIIKRMMFHVDFLLRFNFLFNIKQCSF